MAAMRMVYFLLPGLGVALSCALGAVLFRAPPQDRGPRLACPVLQSRLATADRIEITHDRDLLWLERRGNVWGLARQGGYPVQSGTADQLLDALATVRMEAPAPGDLAKNGTGVRVLAQSGATLCSIVALTPPAAIVRRTGDKQDWTASVPIPAYIDLAHWSQTALPPIAPARVTAVAGYARLGPAPIEQALARLSFTDVRSRPQIRAEPVRTIAVMLTNGTAVLTVGVLDHQTWLTVSGTSPWAEGLAPYAFALPPDSILDTM
jgi:hypothetical protein